jgi:hypothetical protein
MKKMQHIHIIMLTLLFIGFVVSIGFTLNKFQVMLHSKNNVTTMINTLPIFSAK